MIPKYDRSENWRLPQFHDVLSRLNDRDRPLEKCIWVSASDAHTCTFVVEESPAQNLDIFQLELAKTKACKIVFFAINVNAGDYFSDVVPWDWPPQPRVYLGGLCALILQDHWPTLGQSVAAAKHEMLSCPPSSLTWEPKLPSHSAPISDLVHCEPTLHGLTIRLEWPSKPPPDCSASRFARLGNLCL